jgi:hypothetical protein
MSGVSAVAGATGHALAISEKLSSSHAPSPVRALSPPVEGAGPSPFARMVHGLGQEINRGEAMMRHASQSATAGLDPGELLVLQAGVYRYGEAIDLASKLVDHATSGLKTVLQGNQ